MQSIRSSVGSAFDLTSKIYSLTSSIVTRVVFGNKCQDDEELVQLLHAASEQLGRFRFVDLFPSMKLIHLMTRMEAKLMKIHNNLDKVLEDILEENQKKHTRVEGGESALGEENLVQVLLRTQRSENLDVPITTNNVEAVIWDVVSGGTDTSATTLEWAMSEMMRNPRVIEKAQAEALGRDPNFWYDAERFIPERFQSNSNIDFKGTNFEYVPFGAGRRMCPGISFGLASVELPLASLLYHFDWELPNGVKPEDLDMTETLGVTARRKNNLCLIPTPYKIDPLLGSS